MTVSEFLNQLELQPYGRGRTFGELSQIILYHLSADENKRYSPASIGKNIDGIAPEGIDNLDGPTAVIIHYSKATEPPIEWMTQEVTFLPKNFNSVLIIIGGPGSARFRERLNTWVQSVKLNVQVRIWGNEEISRCGDRYAEYLADLVPQLRSQAVQNIVSKGIDDTAEAQSQRRERHLEQLRVSFARNDLVLFLGAGVSRAAGLPTWDELLSKLFVQMVGTNLPTNIEVSNDEKQALADALKDLHANSPLLEARYLEEGLSDDFLNTVRLTLYAYANEDEIRKCALLEAVSTLCMPKRDGPGVRAVVTYNFDDLVERHLAWRGVRYRPICRDMDVPSQSDLGIYHVHGYLPQNPDGISDKKTFLVFSEESYHKLYSDPYTWSNISQLNFLRENTVLMIGISVSDPNLRRLLDIAIQKNQTARHYVIQKRVALKSGSSKQSRHKIKDELLETFASVHHKLIETSFQKLGLNVIWVDDFSAIPNLISRIRS